MTQHDDGWDHLFELLKRTEDRPVTPPPGLEKRTSEEARALARKIVRERGQ